MIIPRKARPFVFTTTPEWADLRQVDRVPGVVVEPETHPDGSISSHVWCTRDSVDIVSAILEQPIDYELIRPFDTIDVARDWPGYERYCSTILPRSRTYQPAASYFVAGRSGSICADPMRCLDGDTTIIVNRAGCAKRMRLRTLHEKLNRADGRYKWRTDIETRIPCYDGHGSIISNRIVRSIDSGTKEAFRIVVESGLEIVASADHEFLTTDGYVCLSGLSRGDVVLTRRRDRSDRTGPRPNPYRVVGVKGHPHARVYTFAREDGRRETCHHVLKHRLIYEAHVLNGMSLSDFVDAVRSGDTDHLDFLDPKYVVHHRNGNASDNHPSNLIAVSKSDHATEHAKDGCYRHVLFRSHADRIVSIKRVGERRMFDLVMAEPYRNFVANDFIVHNCGKNMEVLGAGMITGTKRTLILTLGTPKRGWAEDIAKWCGDWALMLDGRAGTDAWWFCSQCIGKGLIKIDGVGRVAWPRCETCRGRGWIRPKSVIEALESARYVVANYDIIISQKDSDEYGRIHTRLDLPGWLPKIVRHFKPTAVRLDEAHRIGKKGARRNAVRSIVEYGPDQVTGVTGTPFDGQVGNLWFLLDLVSGCMWGRTQKRFAARYAAGYEGLYGFEYVKRGKTPLADTELPERLAHLMIKRERHEIAPHLPPIQRHVVRIEAPSGNEQQLQSDPNANPLESSRVLNATARIKLPHVIDAILDELREGHKIACFSRNVETGHAIAEAIAHAMTAKRTANAFIAVNAQVWDCIGKSSEQRVNMADAISIHDGAGLFQATIDGFQYGRSLEGITANHYPDLHWDPTAIQQCGARGDTWDRKTPLVEVFWVLSGSGDEHYIEVLIPKLESLESVFKDNDAGKLRDTFSPRETLADVWARHTAHLRHGEAA